MVDLFKPYRISEVELRNRFIRSATTSAYSTEDGIVRDEIIRYYEQLARGGVGLIIKGHSYIDPRGKAHQGMSGIHDDRVIPKLKELTDTVHRHNGVIFIQLNYGGYQASAGDRMGPSDFKTPDWEARAMTIPEIWGVIDKFGEAAKRAVNSGFDGIQIHAAHGYLVSQFLSKHTNKRTDDWGGNLQNRMRFLKEVYDEIRSRIGSTIPISMKINCDDFSLDGFNVDESAQIAHAMFLRGMDMIEVSGGGIGRDPKLRERAKHTDPTLSEAIFAGACEKIREVTRPKPLSLVNGFRYLATMQAVVDRDICDLISISRPLIREPDLINKLQRGQQEGKCIRCDNCHKYFNKNMLGCYVD